MATLASIQETTLDVAWIRDGVICFGNRPAERCYRAALTTEGPPEAFAVEADRVQQPAVDAYASFLNGLAYPIQVLVRALPIDLASYARRLEDRAADLPPTLAASARADAVWARQTGPALGLLDRARRSGAAGRRHCRRGPDPPSDSAEDASRPLVRHCLRDCTKGPRGRFWMRGAPRRSTCSPLPVSGPSGSTIRYLVRLFHGCWSRGQSARFDQDLGTCLRPLPEGGA